MSGKISESEMASIITEWLHDQRWEVYQEVLCGGPRCDIVAVQGPVVWAIETKTTMSLALIGQAINWIPYANYVSVGVPYQKQRTGERILRRFGIGVLQPDWMDNSVLEKIRPEMRRKTARDLRVALCDEQKTYADAGNNKSRFYSPFKRTRDNLVSLVQARPGIKFSEAIEKIDYHYSSRSAALSSLRIWINRGVIGEIRIDNGRLFPKPHTLRQDAEGSGGEAVMNPGFGWLELEDCEVE